MLSQEDLMFLCGFKGLLAWLVCQSHFIVFFVKKDWFPIISLLTADTQVTMIFFIISGFGAHVFSKDTDFVGLSGQVSAIRKKFLRLAPIYYLSLAAYVLAFYPFYEGTWSSLIASIVCTMTMSQGFVPQNITNLNPTLWQAALIMWSLAAFMFLYPKLKVLNTAQLSGAFVLCWLAPYLIVDSIDFAGIFGINYYTFFPVRVFHFFAGVITGLIMDKITFDQNLDDSWNKLSDLGLVMATVIRLLGVFRASILEPADFLLMPFHALWLVALIKGKKSLLRKMTCSPIAITMGLGSFSISCMHMPLYYWITRLFYGSVKLEPSIAFSVTSPMVFGPYYCILFAPIAAAVGYFAYVLIEAPTNKLISRLCR